MGVQKRKGKISVNYDQNSEREREDDKGIELLDYD